MALPVQQQALYWGIAAAVFFAVLWLLGDILLPFLVAGAIAYCLDPIADRLERLGMSRGIAVATISVAFVLAFIFVAVAVVPTLVRQALGLAEALPQLSRDLRDFVISRVPGGLGEGSPIADTLAGLGDSLRERALALVDVLIGSAMGVVNLLMLFFVVPIVSIYLLIDWDRLVARVDDLLPRDHAPTIRRLAGEMDATLNSFIRGQGLVCLIQGTFYVLALTAAGLNFALVVGFVSGLLSFIPFVGSVTGFVLAVGLAAVQFWGDWVQIALIAGIFVFGQIVEGNILTPKLVGSSVGLHPVWLLLALSAFGAVFGFVGLLVAVPVTAMIAVLVRFAVAKYKQGLLYRGHSGRGASGPDAGGAAQVDPAAPERPGAAAE